MRRKLFLLHINTQHKIVTANCNLFSSYRLIQFSNFIYPNILIEFRSESFFFNKLYSPLYPIFSTQNNTEIFNEFLSNYSNYESEPNNFIAITKTIT